MARAPYITSIRRMKLLAEMEEQFNEKNVPFFESLLNNKDNVIRTRSVCILASIAGEKAVEPIVNVLKNDPDALVRHEAAFSLGQLGFTGAIASLVKSIEDDPSFFVRHEAAIALGVIGSEDARRGLVAALSDPSEEVRESAKIALANLDYLLSTNRNNTFSKMTGG
jgi:HEAT repeat protein